jgi:pSer/pThr/pTyr-binding forkhead associated (FHA) protein
LSGVIVWRIKSPSGKTGINSRKDHDESMPVIVGIMGEFNEKTISIPKNGLTLGRTDPEEGVLGFGDQDLTIGRVHCRIQYNQPLQQFEVVDLNSQHGTFLSSENDKLAPHRKYNCPAGTILRIGQYNKFNLGGGAA